MSLSKRVPLIAIALIFLGAFLVIFSVSSQSSKGIKGSSEFSQEEGNSGTQQNDQRVITTNSNPIKLFTTAQEAGEVMSVSVPSDCFKTIETDSDKKQKAVSVSTQCLIQATGGRHEALWAKYAYLNQELKAGWAVLLMSQDVRIIVPKVLDFVVGDSDLELRTSACQHHTAKEYWYRFGASANFDTFNGFWEIPQKNAWLCNVPWYWLSASYDPSVFFARPTQPVLRWVGEMQAAVERSARGEKGSPIFEDFTETDAFNSLTVYREDKYLLVRRFPVNYFWSDVCTIHSSGGGQLEAVGRIRHVTLALGQSKDWDKHHKPMPVPGPPPPEPVPAIIPCSRTEGDDLCKAMWRVGKNVNGTMSVGVCILSGDFLTRQEPDMASVPRADVVPHTLCACLDDEGCESCKALGAVPFRMEMNLKVPGAEGKGLVNIYKYYLALAVLRRGFGVLSYDLDVLFLRSPWEYFHDPNFDLFISTDAHTQGWQSNMQDKDVFVYKRGCVNTGMWYVKPTVQGRNLFHRVTAFFNATGTRETDFYFEQAMVHAIIMQTRTINYAHAAGDVRYRFLPPRLFMNSKSVLVLDTDPAAVCSAVSVHSNYHCPYGVIHRTEKGTWLNHVARTCEELKPSNGWAADTKH